VSTATRWQQYRAQVCECPRLGLRIDASRMGLDPAFRARMQAPMMRAFADMEALERGAIANPDENRRVGHYWLRAPWLAPTAALTRAIEAATQRVAEIAAEIHAGLLKPPAAERFSDLLVIGIGGSALGPQLLARALGDVRSDRVCVHFFDNTDPAGMDRVLAALGERIDRTLFVVISKSGSTAETRNGMQVVRAAAQDRGLDFARQGVAITEQASALDRMAEQEGWLARLPMWDFVGGRTSITSAAGLLPAALLGIDTGDLLAGAAACDEATRRRDVAHNPAALLALGWYRATDGHGGHDMVILPYRDCLALFPRYLQQLVMESLGKAKDLDGRTVAQGIAVYGNKGSTDKHAFVQQLRDGAAGFFVTFIESLEDGASPAAQLAIEDGVTSGDYLRGFLLGTRKALTERQRKSLLITLPRIDAWTLGVLIALFERAVGLYASLTRINAYHQPGVEAGKLAAAAVLALQARVLEHLRAGGTGSAETIAAALEEPDVETVFHLLEGLAANGRVLSKEDYISLDTDFIRAPERVQHE